MVKIPRVVSGLAYVAGMLGLAALILFYGSPGATVARSYAAYNGRPVPDTEGKIYRNVDLPYDNTLSPVTATEAREIQNGFIIFAFPTCPFCRNLLPVLADVARAENLPVAYCRIDTYRDRYVYSAEAAAPVQTQPAGEGYAELLTWLDNCLDQYTVSDENKNPIPVGEKRIHAPTLVKVQNGVPVSTWELTDMFGEDFPTDSFSAWDGATQTRVAAALQSYLKS